MSQEWTLESLEQYLVSKTHHKKPGLPASDKRALVIQLTPTAQQWIPGLLVSSIPAAREVAAQLIGPLWMAMPEYSELVVRLAGDPDWEVREWAVSPLVDRYRADPASAWGLYQKWVKEGPDVIQRALAVAIKVLAKVRDLPIEPLIALVDGLVAVEADFVRRNLGPFCIGDSLLPNYPEETLRHLTGWVGQASWAARWNAAAAFTAKRSHPLLVRAADFIGPLENDPDIRVRRAAFRALRLSGLRDCYNR